MTQSTSNAPSKGFQQTMKLVNPMMKGLLRSPLHFFVSGSYLLITFTGRKSGTVYSTPVQYRRDGSHVFVISSAGYLWWKNLVGGADVQVRIKGVDYAGRAEASPDSQVVAEVLQKVYPQLSAEQQAKFVPGKVAITITLITP